MTSRSDDRLINWLLGTVAFLAVAVPTLAIVAIILTVTT